ncbi:ABC transporter permease [Paenibacillus cymbidii]|uniref:ABC transporter permease n=1 Tax=Paenibacillus cymbidii TaxID=1639034 RepID=UPI0010802915|nr:ABC transporter permease subunit [Paenibacillus cymbidii]
MAEPESHVPILGKTSYWRRVIASKYLILMFLPTLVYYVLFQYLPMFGIAIAFKNYNVRKGVWGSDWVGFRYFELFFSTPDFLILLKNTFLLGLYSVIWGFPAPLLLALLINEIRSSVFKRFVQTVSYLPHFISNVVVVSMLTMFLSPSGGLINTIIGLFGVEPVYFLSLPEAFRTIYISSGIWQSVGWGTIIYLAALTTVDPHLYEAADIDGAGRWKKIWHISMPSISSVIVLLLILNIGGLLSTGFEKVFLLYNPLTYETADIISTYTYRVGLVNGNFSYAAAIGVFNGVTNLLLLLAANSISKKYKEVSLW